MSHGIANLGFVVYTIKANSLAFNTCLYKYELFVLKKKKYFQNLEDNQDPHKKHQSHVFLKELVRLLRENVFFFLFVIQMFKD